MLVGDIFLQILFTVNCVSSEVNKRFKQIFKDFPFYSDVKNVMDRALLISPVSHRKRKTSNYSQLRPQRVLTKFKNKTKKKTLKRSSFSSGKGIQISHPPENV